MKYKASAAAIPQERQKNVGARSGFELSRKLGEEFGYRTQRLTPRPVTYRMFTTSRHPPEATIIPLDPGESLVQLWKSLREGTHNEPFLARNMEISINKIALL